MYMTKKFLCMQHFLVCPKGRWSNFAIVKSVLFVYFRLHSHDLQKRRNSHSRSMQIVNDNINNATGNDTYRYVHSVFQWQCSIWIDRVRKKCDRTLLSGTNIYSCFRNCQCKNCECLTDYFSKLVKTEVTFFGSKLSELAIFRTLIAEIVRTLSFKRK